MAVIVIGSMIFQHAVRVIQINQFVHFVLNQPDFICVLPQEPILIHAVNPRFEFDPLLFAIDQYGFVFALLHWLIKSNEDSAKMARTGSCQGTTIMPRR